MIWSGPMRQSTTESVARVIIVRMDLSVRSLVRLVRFEQSLIGLAWAKTLLAMMCLAIYGLGPKVRVFGTAGYLPPIVVFSVISIVLQLGNRGDKRCVHIA